MLVAVAHRLACRPCVPPVTVLPSQVLQLLALSPDHSSLPSPFSDSVAGFSPVFGRLAPPKQRQLIANLLARVAALRQGQQGAPAAAAGQPPTKASVAAVAAEALARLGSLSVSSSAASSEREESEDELGALSAAQRQALGTLRELCALPDACDAFLAHVLAGKGGGDVEVRRGCCPGSLLQVHPHSRT